MLIDFIDPLLEDKLFAREKVHNQLRATGEEAPAKILSMTDTGIRVGDSVSRLLFGIDVFPRDRVAFRANTQQTVLDSSRLNFVPGATIYVKYDPNNPKQVEEDHTSIAAPTDVAVKYQSCGASLTLVEGQATCSYCGSPLHI